MNEMIAFRSREAIMFSSPEDIIYLKSESTYTRIRFASNQEIRISRNRKSVMKQLEGCNFFFSPHRSWMVNLRYVTGIDPRTRRVLLKGNLAIPLTLRNKRELLRSFGSEVSPSSFSE